MITGQRYTADLMVKTFHQLLDNVMRCWSTTLPSLVIRGLSESEINPQILVVQPSYGATRNISLMHDGLLFCKVWLLEG